MQQVTEAPYGRPLLQYSLSQTQPHIRRDNYADHYPTQGFYQPPAFYPGYQQVPLFSYGSGFAANEWTPLSGLDPFIAPTSRTTGSGSVEQHPFPTLSPVRPSMNLRQTGGQQYNSTQYGARHQETSLPPAESSSSCQGSFESSTDTLSSEHDSRQTNQCSHRQAQHAFSHPHPAYAGPYGSFGQYPATYPPPPGFYSYPSSTPQQWGYGSATQHLTGDRVGHSAHYVQEPFNPGTSAYTSSARRSDQAATRSSNQDDLQARDDEEFKHESPRPSHSVVRDLPRSRKCTRRPRPSESSRATSRRSTRSTRSKKKPAKYARRSPPGTPHTVDPAVSEMVERFQQQQPHVREKKRAATIARGTWSTREEAFVSTSQREALSNTHKETGHRAHESDQGSSVQRHDRRPLAYHLTRNAS